MSGGEVCGKCLLVSDPGTALKPCNRSDCPQLQRQKRSDEFFASLFMHTMPRSGACDHDFQGWREIDAGRGGEQVCTKCGIGAMEHTLRTGP